MTHEASHHQYSAIATQHYGGMTSAERIHQAGWCPGSRLRVEKVGGVCLRVRGRVTSRYEHSPVRQTNRGIFDLATTNIHAASQAPFPSFRIEDLRGRDPLRLL